MYSYGAPPLPPGRPPQTVVVPAEFSVQQPLWQNGLQLKKHLQELIEHAVLLKAVAAELEAFESLESTKVTTTEAVSNNGAVAEKHGSKVDIEDAPTTVVSSVLPSRITSDGSAVPIETVSSVQTGGRAEQSLGAAVELQNRVTNLLAPLQGALGAPGGWEHVAAAARLRSKRDKIRRNRKWRKRKRQRIAEARLKEQEAFEEADRKVDEWRAREIAKSIALRKMEKMKEVAEKKAKEDKAEVEMVLMVEKLQELRALRIQKLKKQGRFFPDEDDKFMERVRAAVEEEERQAAAAADTRAAAAAIASASEAAGQVIPALKADADGPLEERASDAVVTSSVDQNVPEVPNSSSKASTSAEEEKGPTAQEAYKLPAEFYHFYFGSQLDLGTLIEVRRAWDAYLMPGGSRIPGHWIEAPPPADAVWASFVVSPASKVDTSRNAKPSRKRRKQK